MSLDGSSGLTSHSASSTDLPPPPQLRWCNPRDGVRPAARQHKRFRPTGQARCVWSCRPCHGGLRCVWRPEAGRWRFWRTDTLRRRRLWTTKVGRRRLRRLSCEWPRFNVPTVMLPRVQHVDSPHTHKCRSLTRASSRCSIVAIVSHSLTLSAQAGGPGVCRRLTVWTAAVRDPWRDGGVRPTTWGRWWYGAGLWATGADGERERMTLLRWQFDLLALLDAIRTSLPLTRVAMLDRLIFAAAAAQPMEVPRVYILPKDPGGGIEHGV